MVVGNNICTHFHYGLNLQDSMPIVRNGLWRIAMGALNFGLHDPVASMLLLGTICGLLTILLQLRLARLLFPFPPFLIYAACLLAFAPGFSQGALSGQSAAAGMLLVSSIFLVHIEGVHGRRRILPVSEAILVGVAVWIRLEFVAIWPLLVLHAFLDQLFPRVSTNRPKTSQGLLTAAAIEGSLIIALFLLPIMLWNTHTVGVPWPRMPGATLSMDSLMRVQDGRIALALHQAAAARAKITAAWFGHGSFAGGWVVGAFFWTGFLMLAVLGISRHEERPFLVLLVVLIGMPFLLSLLAPFLGTNGSQTVAHSFLPVSVLLAGYGLFRLPFLLESIYRRHREGLPEGLGFRTWWAVLGFILVVACSTRSFSLARGQFQILKQLSAQRTAVAKRLKPSDTRHPATVATDRPGWTAFALGVPVIDLTGEGTPRVLRCVSDNGVLEADCVTRMLKELRPQRIVLWGDEFKGLQRSIGGKVESVAPGPSEKRGILLISPSFPAAP